MAAASSSWKAEAARTFGWRCRSRARARLKLRASLVAGVSILLFACATTGPERGGAERDWAAYGAGAYSNPASQRFAAYAAAEREHAANPSAGSALRLAILSLGLDEPKPDYEFVLSLLGFAEGATDDDSTREFAAFLRPIVQTLAIQHASLEAEGLERRSLERQLDALKALEEELNAGEGR